MSVHFLHCVKSFSKLTSERKGVKKWVKEWKKTILWYKIQLIFQMKYNILLPVQFRDFLELSDPANFPLYLVFLCFTPEVKWIFASSVQKKYGLILCLPELTRIIIWGLWWYLFIRYCSFSRYFTEIPFPLDIVWRCFEVSFLSK